MIFAAQATIEFVGIILFTTQLATGGAGGRGGAVVGIMPQMPPETEAHVAVMAFPSSDLVLGSLEGDWNVVTLPAQALSYVRFLPGDQVTFETNVATNPAPGAPAHLRHLKPEWELSNGHAGFDLANGYKPPYEGAVVVVKLTEGFVDGCASTAHPGRMDTIARFQSDSVLRVVATNRRTGVIRRFSLRVDGSAFVIAHVPETYIQTGVAAGNHYMAYCAMADKHLQTCPVPEPVNAPACSATTGMLILQTPSGYGTNADCSNTQWP
ncbi:MAG TPA: hypothetical protein VH087_00805 [Thermoanaerobaculia bacterium]|nr:hypothetical protein [Thermoanaerobaculia bacterium]